LLRKKTNMVPTRLEEGNFNQGPTIHTLKGMVQPPPCRIRKPKWFPPD
jgi:hypothetical protein